MSATRRQTAAGRARVVHRRRRLVVLAILLVAVLGGWMAVSAATAASSGSSGIDAVPLDATRFATGACMAYGPTAGDRHATVFLDAGHGGLDPGAVGTTSSGATIDEATATLPVELDTMALLRAAGYRVVVSRTTDSSVVRLTPADVSGGELTLRGAHADVAARDQCADLAGAAVLVGIYFDSGASPSDAGSVTTYDTARPFSADDLRLATLLQQDVLAAMNAEGWGIPDNGVQPDSVEGSLVPTTSTGSIAEGAASYGHVLLLGPAKAGYFTTPSTMPGALIEPLFVTDPFEGSLAAGAASQQVLARGIATAVRQFLSPAHAAGTTTTG